jgi:hypothetical protein
LQAVQVKDTAASGSVTLNTPAVRDAVEAFVDLVARNKGYTVELRFLTTAPIGTEHKLADRPAGEAGLVYWRRAAAGADVEPVRAMLTEGTFAPAVIEFVNARNNDELRRDLLQKMHWDCGAPDLSNVLQELEERLIVFGRDKFNLGSIDVRPLADVLMYHVLKKSILKNRAERVLTREELYRAVDAATQVAMPRRAVGALAQLAPALAGVLAGVSPSGSAFSAEDTGWIIPGNDLPIPRGVIPRQELAARIGEVLVAYGQVFLVGGSGLGKSLVARDVARSKTGGFATIDLRNVEAKEASRRLDFTLGRIGALKPGCIIFDDLNYIEDGRTRTAFARCGEALRRRDRVAVVTCYRRPSQRTLTELGLDARAVIELPYFTQAEATEIVRLAGGQRATNRAGRGSIGRIDWAVDRDDRAEHLSGVAASGQCRARYAVRGKPASDS